MHDQEDISLDTEQLNRSRELTVKSAGCSRPSLLFIAAAFICVLLLVTVPMIRKSRQSARQSVCQNNLKQIGLAFQNYYDTYKVFPPAIIRQKGISVEKQVRRMEIQHA